jgi:hypothetical protein
MSAFFNPWGMLAPSSLWGRYNNLRFMIRQMLANLQTAALVQVQACSNTGGISPVGTVDVQILVNQVDGQGHPMPHVTMYRMHDFSDGMYLGGLLNGIPTQYVQLSSSGISIISPTAVTIKALAVNAENGGTPEALVNDTFFQWFSTNVYPFLVSKGYTGPSIPSGSETTVLKGQ